MKRQTATTAPLAAITPEHFRLDVADAVALITLNRPERKNPLTFESYAELRDTFRALRFDDGITAVVVAGAGGNFSSGGDVFEIIEPLTRMGTAELHAFTTMTGDLVKAMRACPQPDRGRRRGRLRRRRRDPRHGVRPPGGTRPAPGSPSCSTASASPAATWAPAPSCRASSARAAPPSCSTPAASMTARRRPNGLGLLQPPLRTRRQC